MFPRETFLAPGTICLPPSRDFIQTELEGTGDVEFISIEFQPGNETAVISAISGSKRETVMLKPDSPSGTSSSTIWIFGGEIMSTSTVWGLNKTTFAADAPDIPNPKMNRRIKIPHSRFIFSISLNHIIKYYNIAKIN